MRISNGNILNSSLEKKIDTHEVMAFPLTLVPLSFANIGDCIIKTLRSVLMFFVLLIDLLLLWHLHHTSINYQQKSYQYCLFLRFLLSNFLPFAFVSINVFPSQIWFPNLFLMGTCTIFTLLLLVKCYVRSCKKLVHADQRFKWPTWGLL